ncbi:MAG TPA: response regulator transcription factor [Chloroflexi bacterium]|nr:response regulator transcription factor [Chloroflexota bacterium]
MTDRSSSILIADDEENIRFVLQRVLQREGYVVDTAVNGRDALNKLQQRSYDLLLLDLQMEPVSGMELFQTIRELDKNIVVVILTAHGSMDSAIEALRLGAFDYLLKPASPDLIRSRVREGLTEQRKRQRRRRLQQQIEMLQQTLSELEAEELSTAPPVDGRFLQSGGLLIDQRRQTAALHGRILNLTTTEFNLLNCLVRRAPEPVSAQELVQCAAGYKAPLPEARELVKWHIHQLRRKIEENPSRPQYIKTIRHKGYLWSA